jgi:hypothetical protein
MRRGRLRRLAGPALAAGSTLLTLALAELGLRLAESRGPGRGREVHDYGDAWRGGELGQGGFLREGFSGWVEDGYGGRLRWRNDASGFRRDGETAGRRAPGSLRLLSLGDSFTAGYRVGQQETFSYLLERHLRATGRWREVEVLISAVEEPATGFLYLARHGVGWQPDLVLLGVTLGNDIGQAYLSLDPRGELRLAADRDPPAIGPNPAAEQEALLAELRSWTLPAGCFDPARAAPPDLEPRPEPEGGLRLLRLVRRGVAAWREREAAQTVSSLWMEYRRPRLFDNNGLGMYLADPPPPILDAYDRLFAVLAAYDAFLEGRGIRFAVALFPQRFQVQPRDWQATVAAYGLDPACFDLAAPTRRIAEFCRAAEISCLDPTESMARQFAAGGRSLYLPRADMHWNGRGHRAFFEATREELAELAALSGGHQPGR